MSDVSDLLPDGALFFNFCFDWWFTEPLHPDETSAVVVEAKFPCTKCDKKFKFDWEVPKHYLEVHLAASQEKPKEVSPLPPPAPVKKEPTPEPEVYVEPYPPLEDWRWEDFLPDWDKPFLPSGHFFDFEKNLDGKRHQKTEPAECGLYTLCSMYIIQGMNEVYDGSKKYKTQMPKIVYHRVV